MMTEQETRTRMTEVHAMVTRARCCTGYTNIGHTTLQCVATCPGGCGHGTCDAPGQCRCDPGYSGRSCDQHCPGSRWGPECRYHCECEEGEHCDHETGECWCPAGVQCGDHQTTALSSEPETTTSSPITSTTVVLSTLKQPTNVSIQNMKLRDKTKTNTLDDEQLLLVAAGTVFAILLFISVILTATYFRLFL